MFTSGRADIGANVANPWNERAITAEISELGLPWARQALEIPLASLYETELDVPKHRARRRSDLYFDRQLRDRLSLSLPGILHTRPAGGAGGLLVRQGYYLSGYVICLKNQQRPYQHRRFYRFRSLAGHRRLANGDRRGHRCNQRTLHVHACAKIRQFHLFALNREACAFGNPDVLFRVARHDGEIRRFYLQHLRVYGSDFRNRPFFGGDR